MIIDDFEDFVYWLNDNYDQITEKQYKAIMLQTLQVYESHKPKNKKETIKKIVEFHNKWNGKFETPLFFDIEYN